MKTLKIRRLDETAKTPEFYHRSPCFDLKASLSFGKKVKTFNPWNKEVDVPVKMNGRVLGIQVHPGYRVMVPTGLSFEVGTNEVLKIYSQGQLAVNRGLMLVDGVTIIDCRYPNEVFIHLYNTSDGPITINDGDSIAQAILETIEPYEIEEISEASNS
jgi:dUTP pyrophosphatase